jgi:CheR methyltransferase, SAM binding domain
MRFPVKFNRSNWPEWITKNLPSAADPRVLCREPVDELLFSNAVSTFKFGSTFKSTQKARFPITIAELSSLAGQSRPVILDVGASDGITSLDVMKSISFSKYFVTDLHIEIAYQVVGDITWFYDENGTCILRVTDKWVIYPDVDGAIFPFDRISQFIFARAPELESEAPRNKLINPALKAQINPDVIIERHNILETWPHEKADLIIAGNILNQVYFTASEIEQALKKLLEALNENGFLVIIDNRPNEMATIFQFNDNRVKIIKKINGGTEIENLALNIFSKINSQTASNKTTVQV